MLREIQRAVDALKLVPADARWLVLAEVGDGKKKRGPKPGRKPGRKPGPKPGSKRQKPGPKPGPKPKIGIEQAPVKVSAEKLEKLKQLRSKLVE